MTFANNFWRALQRNKDRFHLTKTFPGKVFPLENYKLRIPTVKLKIPKKAFLKSESRTSVTFKLQFLTYQNTFYIFHNFVMVVYLLSPNRCHWQIAKIKNYNLNETEIRDSDFKNSFSGIFNFTVGILIRLRDWKEKITLIMTHTNYFVSKLSFRIPTVKLKIPGNAFLKSESRASVTFKLQFLTLAIYQWQRLGLSKYTTMKKL